MASCFLLPLSGISFRPTTANEMKEVVYHICTETQKTSSFEQHHEQFDNI